ncbi:hypothetical protein V6N13_120116 [Hibiscus sabdariffa]
MHREIRLFISYKRECPNVVWINRGTRVVHSGDEFGTDADPPSRLILEFEMEWLFCHPKATLKLRLALDCFGIAKLRHLPSPVVLSAGLFRHTDQSILCFHLGQSQCIIAFASSHYLVLDLLL